MNGLLQIKHLCIGLQIYLKENISFRKTLDALPGWLFI